MKIKYPYWESSDNTQLKDLKATLSRCDNYVSMLKSKGATRENSSLLKEYEDTAMELRSIINNIK